MLLSFKLSMPQNSSWNGKWTGEGNLYARIKDFSEDENELAQSLIGDYSYDFGDGWVARIDVKKVSNTESIRIEKKSQGFCGYEWMIKSIIENKEIICPSNKYLAGCSNGKEGSLQNCW